MGAEVGALSADDADSGFTYTLSADEARFEIVDGNTLKLKDGIALNYEQQTEVRRKRHSDRCGWFKLCKRINRNGC